MDECLGSQEAVASSSILRQLIPIQIVSQLVVVSDRILRYCLHGSSLPLRERVRYGWHRGFDIFAVVPFTAYTVLWLCTVFSQHPSPKLFYASQIALQSALVAIQMFLASISTRVLGTIAKKSTNVPLSLITVLGVCTIGMACVPPSAKTCTYRGAFTTVTTLLNEIIAISFLCYCLISANKRTTTCRTIAWIFRLCVLLTTAAFGGFYMRTIWPLWSPQVVIIQQVNLLLSFEVAGGANTISVIKAFRDRKRHERTNVLQPQNQPYSELRSSSLQHQRDGSPSQHQSNSPPVVAPASLHDISTSTKELDESSSVGTQTTNQALKRIATESLRKSSLERTFGEGCTVQKQEVETAEDNLPDETETRMVQEWSKTGRRQRRIVDNEDDYSTAAASASVKIIGIKCKVIGGGVQWWYLTQQADMTLHSNNCTELDTVFGHASIVIPLQNGYQFVRFSPDWVRCHRVPETWKAELWKAIGPQFWSLTNSCSDVIWDARQNRYLNLSEKLSIHLCMEKECEACSRRCEDTY